VYGSAKLLATQHELVDEDASVYYTDDILVAFPESTAPRAETEDLSVGEDDDWVTLSSSPSSVKPSYLVTRFDLSATTVRLLTPTPSDDGCEEIRSDLWSAEYFEGTDVDGDSAESYTVSSDPSTDGPAAAASNSLYRFLCTDGAGHSEEHIELDEDVENLTSDLLDGVVKDVQNAYSSDEVSSLGVKPGNNEDYCECDKLFSHVISDERDFQNSVPSAVSEVVEDSQNISNNGVAPLVDFETEDSGDYRECDESEDDKHPLVGLLSVSEDASDLRYVSSLYVTLAAKPAYYQSSLCSRDDQSFVVDVSNYICTPITSF